MDQTMYNEYVSNVKEWAEDVKHLLADQGLSNRIIKDWIEQMDTFITDLESRLEDPIEDSFIEDETRGIESWARSLYQTSKYIVSDDVRAESKRVPIGEHTLPPLPYAYNALEPYISEKIMRLHHDKHHQTYVEGLNKAEKMLKKAREVGDYDLLKHWEREAAFHGSGHYLHTIFWNNMAPNGGGNPSGILAKQIIKDFGSLEKFKTHFTEAAKKVEGVGWSILVWSPRAHRLEILQSEKHQLFTQWDTIPLLVLDVWEHAYYLQYENKRGEYVKNWWNLVNWSDVEKRYEEAKKLKWKAY